MWSAPPCPTEARLGTSSSQGTRQRPRSLLPGEPLQCPSIKAMLKQLSSSLGRSAPCPPAASRHRTCAMHSSGHVHLARWTTVSELVAFVAWALARRRSVPFCVHGSLRCPIYQNVPKLGGPCTSTHRYIYMYLLLAIKIADSVFSARMRPICGAEGPRYTKPETSDPELHSDMRFALPTRYLAHKLFGY